MHAGLLQMKLAQIHLLASLRHLGGKQIQEAFDGMPERKGGKKGNRMKLWRSYPSVVVIKLLSFSFSSASGVKNISFLKREIAPKTYQVC